MEWEGTVRKAEMLVESTMRGRDASHDAAHACRVRDLALSLAREEGLCDPSSPSYSPDGLVVVELAALLHDIGDYKYTKDLTEDTTIVKRFLEDEGFDDNRKEKILGIIKGMGIARCFTFGGSKNNSLHDPAILPRTGLSRETYMNKDEKQTSINHFHEKLLKLKDLMKTKAGQRRAEKRHKFMQDFLTEFYEEWDGRA